MFDFRGKTAIVTGASRGIGAAAAVLFGQFGANVIINYNRNKNQADEVLNRINKNGGQARIFQADISKRAACQSLADFAISEFGGADILVCNAGIWKEAAIEKMPDTALDEMIDANLKSCFYCAGAVVPQMKKQKSGSIVFISSTAGQRGEAYHSHYAATKGALISLTKSLAPELAPFGIMVNCVAPGWVDTDMSHEALVSAEGPKYLSLIPLGRAAKPEEIAWPILFMASSYASFITGEILNVNGGAVLVG
jgi:3-oxoacyl-[acyl-carrier protein] reductase